MAECPHTQRWWEIMDPMRKRMDGALPSEKWVPLRKVFHFEGGDAVPVSDNAIS